MEIRGSTYFAIFRDHAVLRYKFLIFSNLLLKASGSIDSPFGIQDLEIQGLGFEGCC